MAVVTATDFPVEKRATGTRELALLVALAAALRLAFLLVIDRVIDEPDAIHYVNLARQFAAGDLFNFDENLPILYSVLGAFTHLFVDDWERAFWLVSLAASAATVIPVYILAREMCGRETARAAALLVACWPWLVDFGSRIATEALAVSLFFSAIALLHRAMTRGGWALLAAPGAFFLLHLARPEGTFHMLAAPLAAAMFAWRSADPQRWRRTAVLTTGIAALLAAYAAAMRVIVGGYTVSYRAPVAEDLGHYLQRGALQFGETFIRLMFDVLPVMLGPVLLLFAGAGLFAFRPSPANRPGNASIDGRVPPSNQFGGEAKGDRPNIRLELVIAFFCLVQIALATANLSPAPRYMMVVCIAVAIWAARGMVVVGQRAPQHWGALARQWPLAFTLATFALGHAAALAPEFLADRPGLPREYRLAGQWMREHLEPGLILSRKPQIGFYANMPTTGPATDDTVASAVARAVQTGARYFVLDERHGAVISPGLAPLLDPANAPPELQLVRDDLSQWTGARVLIYRVVAPGMTYAAPGDIATSSHMGPDRRRRTASP